MTHHITLLILQIAVLMIGAMLLGHLFDRRLHLPRVLGELAAGMALGPFALGQIRFAALHGPLFPIPPGAELPVSVELYGIAVFASIILLFLAGLETDLKTFLRFAGKASAVGIGGVVVSFLFGAGAARLFLPGVATLMDPQALFLGTLATATSVGITARILSERRKMSSPEGVTILAAAVLDDVLGIVLLAVVVALARVSGAGVDWGRIAAVAGRAFGFWIGATIVGVLTAPLIAKGLKRTGSLEVVAGTALGLGLLLAGLAETVGLAMIIGAYVMGLSLSQTDVADEIIERLHGLQAYLVPLFFATMGLLVDFAAIGPVFVFGLIFAAAGIAGKLIGCGLPALAAGFTARGAFRIGAGMLPRGEVTLIIAGVGLASGAIGPDLFGVAIMTLLVSSVIAPPVLIASFRGGSGYRGRDADGEVRPIVLDLPSLEVAAFMRGQVIDAFEQEGFFVARVDRNSQTYRIRQDDTIITLVQRGEQISLVTGADHLALVRLVLIEAIVELRDMISGLEQVGSGDVGDALVDGILRTE